jgi:hypothetical protein
MTAVKWLFIELTRRGLPPHKEIIKCYEQAKEMEHKQIVDARVTAPLLSEFDKTDYTKEAEQYYNETYNNVQQP